jgi:hypothetical protein
MGEATSTGIRVLVTSNYSSKERCAERPPRDCRALMPTEFTQLDEAPHSVARLRRPAQPRPLGSRARPHSVAEDPEPQRAARVVTQWLRC